jgi:hypothetical protein
MVVSACAPALVVPDEQTWTVLGADPAARGLRPGYDPGTVRRVLAPERVPAALATALAAYADALDDVPVEYGELPVSGGAAVGTLLAPNGHRHHEHGHEHEHDHGHHDHEHGHGGHGGHHDMMAIVGEPSADGLVMEHIELTYGPLGTPLPGGLAAEVTLDGDVVADSTIHALLRSDPPSVPDLLAPVAWTVATATNDQTTSPWLRIAAVEVERAVSHVAWLRTMGRLLDWQPLVDGCTETLASLQVERRVLPGREPTESWLREAVGRTDLDECRGRLEGLVAMVRRSRAFRWRLAGRAIVTRTQAFEQGLVGPVARGSGHGVDVRSDDPAYRELDFEPVVRAEGDALARTLVRSEEALAAVSLALDALTSAYVGADAPTAAAMEPVVESPRGPITARRSDPAWGRAARRAAADAMVGREWSAALVGLMSFDLSPWSAGE